MLCGSSAAISRKFFAMRAIAASQVVERNRPSPFLPTRIFGFENAVGMVDAFEDKRDTFWHR